MRGAILLLALALAIAPRRAPANGADRPTVLVVVGAPGAEEYGARFRGAAESWRKAAARAGARFEVIGLDGAGPDRPRVQAAVAREAGRTGEPLWIVLLGHGTWDGRAARFALRGPDFGAEELAAWLEPARRPLVVVHTGSASGPFLKALSRPDRVIVTATRSGQEKNATRFGTYFSDGIADPRADLDKDGQTSLLEAFLFAARQVEASYTEAGLLATEHALLDDNGDGLGTAASFFRGLRLTGKAAGDGTPDGRRAHQLHLVPSTPERALSPEARRRRDEIEREVIVLRDAREKLGEAEYYARLEPLLLELARLYDRAERR